MYKHPTFSYSICMYINSDIIFSSSFTSTLTSPIHQSDFLSIFYFNSQQSIHNSRSIFTSPLNSPNSCSLFTSTLNSPIHLSKFLYNFYCNSQQSTSIVQLPVQFSLQLSIVQLKSSNSCSCFTSTLRSQKYCGYIFQVKVTGYPLNNFVGTKS